MATRASLPVLHLSLVLGGALRDAQGLRLGKVEDLIVRLGADEYPPVTGLMAEVAGRTVFVPADLVSEIAAGGATLSESTLSLQPFARRPQEVLLKEDVLDHQLINVDGARLVRTNEIEIARFDGWYRVIGVDTGPRGLFRRVLPKRFAGTIEPGKILDWASVEPFTGHVPTVRLRIPHPKLGRLHPAQLADLVEAASHREGGEILDALRADAEREADVFEELDARHQIEFIDERSDEEAAQILARMESDDAADLVGALPEERREDILSLLPPTQSRRVRALLGYEPATAGGLMSPDFVCVFAQATQNEVLDRIARSTFSADALAWVFVMNQSKRLKGAIHLVDLLRADAARPLGELAQHAQRLRADADIEETARLMTDYDLTVVPVVDDEERMIGVITVDDVLEVVLPKGWRRNFGMLADE